MTDKFVKEIDQQQALAFADSELEHIRQGEHAESILAISGSVGQVIASHKVLNPTLRVRAFELLYQGLQNHGTDPNNAYSALLEDMAESKFALVAEGGSVPATHPLVRSGYAVLEAMAAHANATHSYLDRNYFNDALTLLDDTRDAEELAKLKKMLNKF